MRPAQKSNRSRGRGNRKSGGGGGGNNINRVYDSAGPEGKVRGTPQQIIDKYMSLARDAQTSGDRVASENFLQHAEHYQRILILAMGAQEQSRRDAEGEPSGEPRNQPMQDAEPAAPAAKAPEPAPPPADAPAPAAVTTGAEISGMAMIDSGPESDSLLVEEGNEPPAKPRRSPRARKPKADAAPAETAETPAAPTEAPEAAAEG